MIFDFISTTGLSALLAWTLGFPVCRLLLRYGIMDHPNVRSSHSVPTARGGGIALVLSVVAIAALMPIRAFRGEPMVGCGLLAAVVLLALVSFRDDISPLPARLRFACQVLLAAGCLALLRPTTVLALSEEYFVILPPLAALGLGLLWITGYTNAFNFMDGINGLACTQAVVSALGTAFLVLLDASAGTLPPPPTGLCFILAGAALGFLPHNFPKPRMFLGDVGSAPLGLLLAVLVLWMTQGSSPALLLPLILLHANFILDTGITLARRVARGDRWYEPHREHFYQKLIRAGQSHTQVTIRTLFIQLCVLALLLFYPTASAPVRAGLAVAVIVIWLVYYGWVEAYCGRITQSRS